MKGYDQRVTEPDNWLTALFTDDEKDRQFVKVIHLPEGQAWDEWTDAQYQAWKEQYEPETSENENKEDVQ